MIRRGSRGRAGITLTEILISIMIMGVGLVSLATLFPLGLLRLRAAAIKSRSAFLVESAAADLATRNLLSRASFLASGWYTTTSGTAYDPWIQDIPSYPPADATAGAYRGYGGTGIAPNVQTDAVTPIPGPGLPVAYDPLWRAAASNPAGTVGVFLDGTAPEARFGVGTGIRSDPDGVAAAAHGLQRLTNFVNTPANNGKVVPNIFVSPDDMVFQSPDTRTGPTPATGVGSASPIVPEMYLDTVDNLYKSQNDWMYTWMFTGRRSDARDGSSYQGDIVIFHGRPLAVDGAVAAGEPVVEAVFGYSKNILPTPVGYGTADRAVLLRWPATVADPEIKVGGWIADVTYERFKQRDFDRQAAVSATGISYPNQRCHWYQVVKKTPGEPAVAFDTDAGAYRSMTVVVGSKLQAKTPMTSATGHPLHVNVALISRYVVNVFPKTFITR